MLKQATVEDVSNKRITRIHGHVVVVTQYYPRFLRKNLIHEYVRDLAPTRELLKEFKSEERESGDHDEAFDDISYEEKFSFSKEGIEQLKRLAEISIARDVYLVCHCKIGQRCHREILMLTARELFGAKIGKLNFDWEKFASRLPGGVTRD